MAVDGLPRRSPFFACSAVLTAFVFLSLGAASVAEAGTFVAFGPRQFTRTTSTPVEETVSFSVRNPSTSYTLVIDESSVSSAIVKVNGVVIFDTHDFNQQVTHLERAVTLSTANTLAVELRGGPDDRFTVKVVGVDNDLPTIQAAVFPSANAAGWNSSDVSVSFTCDDATSGVATCPAARTISTEGAAQQVSGTATDNAGNSATASVSLNIDKTAPAITITSPANNAVVAARTVTVNGTVADALSGVTEVRCGDATAPVVNGVFLCSVSLVPGNNALTFGATDAAGNSAAIGLSLRLAAAPTVHITAPDNLTFVNLSPITVRGTVSDTAVAVRVGGIDAPLSNGSFSVQVPLVEGNNTITAVAETAAGFAGTASVQVTLDTTAPHVAIHSPPDGFTTTDAAVAVSGLINDIVVGTVNEQQATVTVNGVPAQVANRSFLLPNVPLAVGENAIQVIGRDRVGNSATTSIVVRRLAQTAGARIRAVSGNGQTGTISTPLAQQLVVLLTDAAGQPAANKTVVFKVTQADGTLADAAGAPKSSVAVATDAQGRAQARWTLGTRAGAGNNRVEANATGFDGTALFSATAIPGFAAGIHLDAGSGQIGATAEALPFPFVVVITDGGHNRLGGIPVTFRVIGGGGSLPGGVQTAVNNTDSDGRALTILTLGPDEGTNNNLVEVTVPGATIPIVFAASAKLAGAAADTKISGTVLDNSNNPLAGVTMRLYRAYQASNSNIPVPIGTPAITDAQGQFLMTSVPVGAFKLVADGTTVQRPGAAFPSVEYDIVTISGQNNTVGMPIYLPMLDTVNRLCVSETAGGTLTVPSVPGLAFTVAPGSATFPGGSRSGCITVTPVHGDKVPMVPGFGQQPRFVITIQPAGTHFNPPAQLTMPNVDGLAPRQVTEMYSYDHDLSTFVAIGTGTVSADGSVITSDPGVGVLKAGWHCGGNPNPSGAAACCPPCKKCVNKVCVNDDSQVPKQKSPNDCEKQICKNGAVVTVPDLTEKTKEDSLAEEKFCALHIPSCLTAQTLADQALAWAQQKAQQGYWSSASLHNGLGDAARHAYWNCQMATQLGDAFAKGLSDAHEADTDGGDPCDERDMDQTNNQVGRNLAKQTTGDCESRVLNNLNLLKTLP